MPAVRHGRRSGCSWRPASCTRWTAVRLGNRRRMVFVDLEASGLLPGSFPVEVGWARPRALPNGRCAIDLSSVLVRHEPKWLSSGSWDPHAEAVHGLTRDILQRDGLPAAEVCDVLDREFGANLVATDTGSGSVDDEWLAVLHEAAGREPSGWRVAHQNAEQVILAACRAHGLRTELVMGPLLLQAPASTHAAAEDTLGYAWRYAMVQQLGASESESGTRPASVRPCAISRRRYRRTAGRWSRQAVSGSGPERRWPLRKVGQSCLGKRPTGRTGSSSARGSTMLICAPSSPTCWRGSPTTPPRACTSAHTCSLGGTSPARRTSGVVRRPILAHVCSHKAAALRAGVRRGSPPDAFIRGRAGAWA